MFNRKTKKHSTITEVIDEKRIGSRMVQVNANSKLHSVYVFSKPTYRPYKANDRSWFPGEYDEDTWVKYSKLDG